MFIVFSICANKLILSTELFMNFSENLLFNTVFILVHTSNPPTNAKTRTEQTNETNRIFYLLKLYI